MSYQIHIFYSELENAENTFRKYIGHIIKLIDDNGMPNLFSQIQVDNLDFRNLNNEVSYKVRSFHQLISVRNQVKSIIEAEQHLNNLFNLNCIILDSMSPLNSDSELMNPYFNILQSEISDIPLLKDRSYILIINNPDSDDLVLKVETSEDKELVALKLCNLMVEAQNDGEIISNYKDFISQSSLDFLESIKVPLRKRIDYYNQSLIRNEIDELLTEYWDIDYMVIFKITDIEKTISADEQMRSLYDYRKCKIKEHSVEFHLNSIDEISGENVSPLDEDAFTQLKLKLDDLVYDNLSFDIENFVIQRLYDLCENSDDLVKLEHAVFTDFETINYLKQKLK
jgi:hypothetical protein